MAVDRSSRPPVDAGSAVREGAGSGIVLGEHGGDDWAEGKHAPAIGPWKLAFRRLRRNKTALAFLGLFIVIVAMCLLAPVYSKHIAHIGPNANNVTGTIKVGGKEKDVVSPDGVPLRPTFPNHYFFGADHT